MRRENLERRGLSRREREVLRLLANGSPPSEIAQALRLSLKTVQTYCGRLKQKLGSQSLTQLIRDAVLLCNSETTGHFDASLKRANSIEVRYFDLHGKLIATRKFRTQTMPRLRRS